MNVNTPMNAMTASQSGIPSRLRHQAMPRRQQGVALITAVLIISLVTVAASAMASRQLLDIRRTENILHSEQAYVYALAAEQVAARALLELDEDRNVDHLGEMWAQAEGVPIPMRGGTVTGSIRDATAAFPINSLVNSEGQRQDQYYRAFEKLIDSVLEFAPALPAAILDWIDPNKNLSPDGAEDSYYLNQSFPYRTANRAIASPSELRLVSGMLADDYIRLVPHQGQPFINTLPANTHINVNTAPREVLLSLHDKIEASMIDDIMTEREEAVENGIVLFTDPDKFTDRLADGITFDGETPQKQRENETKFKEEVKGMIDVKSEYFEVTVVAQIGRTTVQLHSLLHRVWGENRVTTIRRGIGVI